MVLASPKHPVPQQVTTVSEKDLASVVGVVLWGPLLDRLNVVVEADRQVLREIGPGGQGRRGQPGDAGSGLGCGHRTCR